MYHRALTTALRITAAVLAAAVLKTAPAQAQRFSELAAGWNAVAHTPTGSSEQFQSGLALRASTGAAVAPHVRIRFDADAMLFRLGTQISEPCPSLGCTHANYDNHTRGAAAVTASGILGLIPDDRVYLIGGGGVYNVETQVNSFHVGALGGFGFALPIEPTGRRLVVEATWHGLAPQSDGPRWFVPISLGLRF